MDFIAILPEDYTLTWVLGILAAIGLILALVSGFRTKVNTGGFVLGFALMFSCAIGSSIAGTGANAGVRDYQLSEFQAQAIDSYGLELTDTELWRLGYPRVEPREDFEVFGSIEKVTVRGDGFEKREIYLIWKDSQMVLAKSTDGESFTPLVSKD